MADPAYNLTKVEMNLLTPDVDDEARTATLCNVFRTAYMKTREGWTFDAAICKRIDVYQLTARLNAMACLPLWYQDATLEKRDKRAAEHRAFVSQYF